MVITFLGAEFFKVQFGDTVLAFNPVSKDSKCKTSRFGSDIALISTNHPDLNGSDQVSYSGKEPFVISGPGEYEIKGVFVRGLQGESRFGLEKETDPSRINTSYLVTLEGMNICFLGALSKNLTNEANEAIDEVDILFVPIGGEGVLSPSDAYKLAVSIEPKLIIPMHYGNLGMKNALALFLKEGGAQSNKPLEKLTIKKKDLEGKEGEIVVLDASVS